MKIFRAEGYEDSLIACLSRELNVDGTALLQADVASISRTVWDQGVSPFTDTPDNPVGGSADALTVADTIYDTYQTGEDWAGEDEIGYNFRDLVPKTMFAAGGHRYRIEYAITLTAGGGFPVVFEYDTKELLGS